MLAYTDPAIDQIYELLFCDNPELYRGHSNQYPWNLLFAHEPKIEDLKNIVDDWNLETRPKILAARKLSSLSNAIDGKRIFGVIVEVGMDEGLDTLAAYEDGTARYINYTESTIVWDTKTKESNELVVDLFLAARKVVEQIGPWDAARLRRPVSGNVRLSFLVGGDLYFGEGPFAVLARDKMGGPVIAAATKLMQLLITRTDDHNL